ncbi:MAG: VOC family protein [Actinomycetota bacterium]
MSFPIASKLPGGGHVDHVVLGVPDTDQAADDLASSFGLRPSVSEIGGSDYPTRSGSLGLGGGSFFELYGPNPTYDGPPHVLRDLLVGLPEPRLLTFMVRVSDLPGAIERLSSHGHRVAPMLTEWERTNAPSFRNAQFTDHALDPAVPRLIEWNDRRGMDDRFVQGVTLARLTARTEDHDRVRDIHHLLGLDDAEEVRLEDGPPGLTAELETPNGLVSVS